jgi:hypothetical protein
VDWLLRLEDSRNKGGERRAQTHGSKASGSKSSSSPRVVQCMSLTSARRCPPARTSPTRAWQLVNYYDYYSVALALQQGGRFVAEKRLWLCNNPCPLFVAFHGSSTDGPRPTCFVFLETPEIRFTYALRFLFATYYVCLSEERC